MKTSKMRSIIALIVVGVFMFITGFLAIFPLVTKQDVNLNTYADFFTKTSGIYTGIIGVIVGYYFARSNSNIPTDNKNDDNKNKLSDPDANT